MRDGDGGDGGYNYPTFDLERETPPFRAFRERLFTGERAPGGELEDLEGGGRVELRKLWSGGLAVLEFGSFT